MATTARSVVVGNAGSCPTGFRFDGDAAGYLDESVVARLESEHCTIASDTTTLYRSVRLTGGAATLLPDGAKIVGQGLVAGVYNIGGPYGWPYQSVDRDLWTDGLCVIAVDADQGGAGLYYTIHDGALYRWPQTLEAHHLCLAQSTTTTDGSFLVGTPHGVYERSSDPTDTTTKWARLGDMARRVTRISVTYTTLGARVLWALVQDQDSGGKVYHGVYRFPAFADAASSSEVEGSWQPLKRTGELWDVVASGPHDYFYITTADPQNVHHVHHDEGAATETDTAMALPSGAQGSALSYVSGPPGHVVTAIYVSVAGAPSPLYLTTESGGVWSALADADPSAKLVDAGGARIGVNAVVESGLTFLGWSGGALHGDAGQYVAAWACCTSGMFWTPAVGGGDWRAVTGANGLADVSVGGVAAGQWIQVEGQPTNRVFVTNPERLYVSHTATNLFEEAAPHATLCVGPYLSAAVVTRTGTLPHNRLKTIGLMASSPIGDFANTHVQITSGAGLLPDGWWWQRSLSRYGAYEWDLVNGAVTTARTVQQPVSSLTVESSARVALLTASGRLAETCTAWLGGHSTPRLDVQVRTTFTTMDAAARLLRASMRVPVRYHGQMTMRADSGDALATTFVAWDDALFFIKSVKWETDSQGGPLAAVCTVDLSTSLSSDRDADTIAAALLDSLNNAHKKHRR